MGMLDQFDGPTQSVVQRAHSAAWRLGYDEVGTRHILLALCDTEAGLAAERLRSAKVTGERIRASAPMQAHAGRMRMATMESPLGFSSYAKASFAAAIVERDRLDPMMPVQPKHLLNALVDPAYYAELYPPQSTALHILEVLESDLVRVYEKSLPATVAIVAPEVTLPSKPAKRARRRLGLIPIPRLAPPLPLDADGFPEHDEAVPSHEGRGLGSDREDVAAPDPDGPDAAVGLVESSRPELSGGEPDIITAVLPDEKPALEPLEAGQYGEMRIETVDAGLTDEELAQVLNDFVASGWEVVSVLNGVSRLRCVLRRYPPPALTAAPAIAAVIAAASQSARSPVTPAAPVNLREASSVIQLPRRWMIRRST